MPKTRVYSSAVAEAPPGRWSNAIRAGEFLFISGQVSRSSDGKTIEGKGEYEQSKIIFTKIKNLVEAAGGTTDDVVNETLGDSSVCPRFAKPYRGRSTTHAHVAILLDVARRPAARSMTETDQEFRRRPCPGDRAIHRALLILPDTPFRTTYHDHG